MIESLSKEQIAVLKQVVNQEKADVPLVATVVKIWEALNSDVSPVFKNFLSQLRAIYSPQLEAIKAGGITIDWVDSATGSNPWFT